MLDLNLGQTFGRCRLDISSRFMKGTKESTHRLMPLLAQPLKANMIQGEEAEIQRNSLEIFVQLMSTFEVIVFVHLPLVVINMLRSLLSPSLCLLHLVASVVNCKPIGKSLDAKELQNTCTNAIIK
jgi:hypothetical protein